MKHYTLGQLEAMPTLRQNHTDDLKIQKKNVRIWLSRMTVADGMPYDNQVTVEAFVSSWEVVEQYQPISTTKVCNHCGGPMVDGMCDAPLSAAD